MPFASNLQKFDFSHELAIIPLHVELFNVIFDTEMAQTRVKYFSVEVKNPPPLIIVSGCL